MKILVPYINKHPDIDVLGSNVISGGTEKFILRLVENFPDIIIPVKIPYDTYRTEYKNIINAAIHKYSPDIIYNNYSKISFFGDPFPGVSYIQQYHNLPVCITSIGSIRRMNTPNRSDVFISGVSNKQKEMFLAKGLHRFDFIVSPDYYDGDLNAPVVENPTFDLCTVGRMCHVKDPLCSIKIKNYIDESLKVIIHTDDIQSALENSDLTKKYFLSYEKRFNDRISIKQSEDHSNVLSDIANSKVYVSTCKYESWGITAMEALTRGLPLLIVSPSSYKTHSSEEVSPSPNFYRKIQSMRDVQQISKAFDDLLKLDRQEIAYKSREFNSREKWVRNIMSMFNTVVESKPNHNNLSSFFHLHNTSNSL